MMAAALAYSQRLGFAVFQTAPDCRVPLKVEGWFEHGCHDATKDPDDIRRRWERFPDANVSVATGDPSGVFVLDIDCKGDVDGFRSLQDLEELFEPLPQTWRSRTPSGGEHRWFRKPADRALINRVGLKHQHHDGGCVRFPGLDIRTTGGSIAAPPSRKPSGPYAWLDRPSGTTLADPPEWLLKLIDPPPLPSRSYEPLKISSSDKAARYVAAAVNAECHELAAMAKNSGRNLRLFQASANLGTLVAAHLLPEQMALNALERAAQDCGLIQEDGVLAVRATISSGLKRGLQNPREVRL